MSTSANVTYYDVYKDGKRVREFSQHHYCKSINLKAKLTEFQPPEAYTIQRRYPDEDEVDHLSNRLNLKLFLEGAQFTEEEDERMSTATNRQETPGDPGDTQYLVCWEIDIWAKDPKEAAKKALAIHRNPESIATIFSVFKDGHYQATVDLTEDTVVQ